MLLITCEHGGNQIPKLFSKLVRPPVAILASHRGYDAGALEVAKNLARILKAPLIANTVSRLLIDLNRPVYDPDLFSQWSAHLSLSDKNKAIKKFHSPHWRLSESLIDDCLRKGRGASVLHLSVHSFTPRLRQMRRPTSIGLLFDESREREQATALKMRRGLSSVFPRLKIDFNQPYQGNEAGLVQSLRERYPGNQYIGFELEFNQATLKRRTARSLQEFARLVAGAVSPR